MDDKRNQGKDYYKCIQKTYIRYARLRNRERAHLNGPVWYYSLTCC